MHRKLHNSKPHNSKLHNSEPHNSNNSLTRITQPVLSNSTFFYQNLHNSKDSINNSKNSITRRTPYPKQIQRFCGHMKDSQSHTNSFIFESCWNLDDIPNLDFLTFVRRGTDSVYETCKHCIILVSFNLSQAGMFHQDTPHRERLGGSTYRSRKSL